MLAADTMHEIKRRCVALYDSTYNVRAENMWLPHIFRHMCLQEARSRVHDVGHDCPVIYASVQQCERMFSREFYDWTTVHTQYPLTRVSSTHQRSDEDASGSKEARAENSVTCISGKVCEVRFSHFSWYELDNAAMEKATGTSSSSSSSSSSTNMLDSKRASQLDDQADIGYSCEQENEMNWYASERDFMQFRHAIRLMLTNCKRLPDAIVLHAHTSLSHASVDAMDDRSCVMDLTIIYVYAQDTMRHWSALSNQYNQRFPHQFSCTCHEQYDMFQHDTFIHGYLWVKAPHFLEACAGRRSAQAPINAGVSRVFAQKDQFRLLRSEWDHMMHGTPLEEDETNTMADAPSSSSALPIQRTKRLSRSELLSDVFYAISLFDLRGFDYDLSDVLTYDECVKQFPKRSFKHFNLHWSSFSSYAQRVKQSTGAFVRKSGKHSKTSTHVPFHAYKSTFDPLKFIVWVHILYRALHTFQHAYIPFGKWFICLWIDDDTNEFECTILLQPATIVTDKKNAAALSQNGGKMVESSDEYILSSQFARVSVADATERSAVAAADLNVALPRDDGGNDGDDDDSNLSTYLTMHELEHSLLLDMYNREYMSTSRTQFVFYFMKSHTQLERMFPSFDFTCVEKRIALRAFTSQSSSSSSSHSNTTNVHIDEGQRILQCNTRRVQTQLLQTVLLQCASHTLVHVGILFLSNPLNGNVFMDCLLFF